jgi:hypothetical protein
MERNGYQSLRHAGRIQQIVYRIHIVCRPRLEEDELTEQETV